ncbi:YjbR protein [Saccharomonospora xinjiangensis]|nr:hypothetical protein EYD13_10220 [Saccharomonospora xinjiangensis]
METRCRGARRCPRPTGTPAIVSVVHGRMSAMGVSANALQRMIDGLADVRRESVRDYTAFSVHGAKFGYHWPRTATVGLKQTLSEQAALVAERPGVFEVQFTAGGFGWVVVHLEGIDAEEFEELLYEAWRLSAPEELAEAHPFTPAGPR